MDFRTGDDGSFDDDIDLVDLERLEFEAIKATQLRELNHETELSNDSSLNGPSYEAAIGEAAILRSNISRLSKLHQEELDNLHNSQLKAGESHSEEIRKLQQVIESLNTEKLFLANELQESQSGTRNKRFTQRLRPDDEEVISGRPHTTDISSPVKKKPKQDIEASLRDGFSLQNSNRSKVATQGGSFDDFTETFNVSRSGVDPEDSTNKIRGYDDGITVPYNLQRQVNFQFHDMIFTHVVPGSAKRTLAVLSMFNWPIGENSNETSVALRLEEILFHVDSKNAANAVYDELVEQVGTSWNADVYELCPLLLSLLYSILIYGINLSESMKATEKLIMTSVEIAANYAKRFCDSDLQITGASSKVFKLGELESEKRRLQLPVSSCHQILSCLYALDTLEVLFQLMDTQSLFSEYLDFCPQFSFHTITRNIASRLPSSVMMKWISIHLSCFDCLMSSNHDINEVALNASGMSMRSWQGPMKKETENVLFNSLCRWLSNTCGPSDTILFGDLKGGLRTLNISKAFITPAYLYGKNQVDIDLGRHVLLQSGIPSSRYAENHLAQSDNRALPVMSIEEFKIYEWELQQIDDATTILLRRNIVKFLAISVLRCGPKILTQYPSRMAAVIQCMSIALDRAIHDSSAPESYILLVSDCVKLLYAICCLVEEPALFLGMLPKGSGLQQMVTLARISFSAPTDSLKFDSEIVAQARHVLEMSITMEEADSLYLSMNAS